MCELWVLPWQNSCLSSAPPGHGRGKAGVPERLLPVLQFQGHPGARTVPASPGAFQQLWVASPGSASLPRAHWPQKGQRVYCTSSVPSPNTAGIIHRYFLTKIFQHCGGAVGRFPLNAGFEFRPLLVKSSQEFQFGHGSGWIFSLPDSPAHCDLTALL